MRAVAVVTDEDDGGGGQTKGVVVKMQGDCSCSESIGGCRGREAGESHRK